MGSFVSHHKDRSPNKTSLLAQRTREKWATRLLGARTPAEEADQKHHIKCWYRIRYNKTIMATARKITVEIPDALLQKAQQASGAGITQTVRTGLQLLAASQTYSRLRQLRGKVRFTRTVAELKADR